jgi:hypothetical protein
MIDDFRAVMALSAALLAIASVDAVAQVGMQGGGTRSGSGVIGNSSGAGAAMGTATNGGTAGTSTSSRGAFTSPINPYITNYGVGGMQPPPGSPQGTGMPRRAHSLLENAAVRRGPECRVGDCDGEPVSECLPP